MIERQLNAMVNHTKSVPFHTQEFMNLRRCELRDADDAVGSRCGIFREPDESIPKLGSGIIARHHEKIMKRRHGELGPPQWQPLIETVEEPGCRTPAIQKKTAPAVS